MTQNKPKILVVDDEPNNHRVYERTLESLNLEFVRALSGQQALGLAHKHDFFLILMDVQMPGMDGFETAALILDHPKTGHIPVIFITAFAQDELFEFKGYASGAVDYLVKPINDDVVRGKVGVFLALYRERLELDRVCKIHQKTEDELRVHKEHLEEIVDQRTNELKTSLENLMDAQTQLVESEKMASLGRLVAGVAHELNTPIGICVTGATLLQDKVNKLISAYTQGGIRKQDFTNFIDYAPQSAELIVTNLNRASELISNFKLVAVDVSKDMVRELNLHDYIAMVLQSLHPQIIEANHRISLTGNNLLTVETCPGSLTQIITNLVMNSIIHAFDEDVSGDISIETVREKDRVKLTYHDNGHGMDEEQTRLIFEPFYTTRRGTGGSGLGMSIVYNLVTQRLKGDLTCFSTVGEGSTFVITFPVKASG